MFLFFLFDRDVVVMLKERSLQKNVKVFEMTFRMVYIISIKNDLVFVFSSLA